MNKKKFGVYFEDILIDVIEAEDQEDAEDIAYDKIEKIPSQLRYNDETIYEDDITSDGVDEVFDNDFSIKPL